MKTFTAGDISLQIGDPFPMWCKLKIGDAEVRFDHRNLRDLRYVSGRAIREAKRQLAPGNALEV